MKVTNNGKNLIIEVSFIEAANIVGAIKKSVQAYEQDGLMEFADQARELINELMNNQIVEMGGK